MNKTNLFLAVLVLFSMMLSCSGLMAQKGHKIDIHIENLSDTSVILGHHWSKSIIPDDTIMLDNSGKGTIKGKEPLPKGMYIIFMPDKSYFDFLIGEDQHFSIKNDTFDYVQNFESEGSGENEVFYEYQDFLINNRKEIDALNQKYKSETDEKAKEKIRDKMIKLNSQVKEKQKEFVKNNEGTLFSRFILATLDPEVPDPPADADSLWQYRYYINHYFENFDLADPAMLRTPFYNEKVIRFLTKIIPQEPDSIIQYADQLIILAKESGSDDVYRNMLVNIFNHYAKSEIMCMDKVFFHVAKEHYLPTATWSDSAYLAKLKTNVDENKDFQCGLKARNFEFIKLPTSHFQEAANDTALKKNPYVHIKDGKMTLYDITTDYTVLAFWEVDCGHCKKQVPKLHQYAQEFKDESVTFVALHMIGSEEGKEKWIDFINQKKLYNWYNVWSPFSYQYKNYFNIKTTPVMVVLDKDKKIIAKRIGPDQVKEILDFYIKKDKKN